MPTFASVAKAKKKKPSSGASGDGFVAVRPRKGGKCAKRVAAGERKKIDKSAPAPSRKEVQEYTMSQGKKPKSDPAAASARN